MSKIGLMVASIATMALIGCVSMEQNIPQATATRLNGEQAKAYISGKTVNWEGGGGYYKSDGRMDVEITRRVKASGTWWVFDDGRVCYKIPEWEEYCHYYVIENGVVSRYYTGGAR